MNEKVIEGDFADKSSVDEKALTEALKTMSVKGLAADETPKPQGITLVPKIQTCLLVTNHGRKINCKFWIHTDKYFQYYEPGYKVYENDKGVYIIEGDTVIVPNHEIQYVIVRGAQSAIPENMFLALGGKKKLIIKVSPDATLRDK